VTRSNIDQLLTAHMLAQRRLTAMGVVH